MQKGINSGMNMFIAISGLFAVNERIRAKESARDKNSILPSSFSHSTFFCE
jgi:hypothetical protein